MWKFNSNFPNRKSLWHMKNLIIPSEKFPVCIYKSCAEHGFYDVTKAQYGWISHNFISPEPHVVEGGFVVQIIRKTNTLTDNEILHLESSHYGYISHILSYGRSPYFPKYLSHPQGRFLLLNKETCHYIWLQQHLYLITLDF